MDSIIKYNQSTQPCEMTSLQSEPTACYAFMASIIKYHHGLKSSSITMASGIKHHLSSQPCEMNITTICRHCTLCFHRLSHQVSLWPQSTSITMASVIKYHHGRVIKHHPGLSHQASPIKSTMQD